MRRSPAAVSRNTSTRRGHFHHTGPTRRVRRQHRNLFVTLRCAIPKPRSGGQPVVGPFFSDAKTASPGTEVHRGLAHEVRSCGRGAEARGRPYVKFHSDSSFSYFHALFSCSFMHFHDPNAQSGIRSGGEKGRNGSPFLSLPPWTSPPPFLTPHTAILEPDFRNRVFPNCHVPDMNLQMCTHLGNLSESERRSEICQLRSEAVV